MSTEMQNSAFYTRVKGERQGQFPDENESDEAKNLGAPCYLFSYGASASNDPGRGADKAARFHEPIVIVKAWGEASANYLQAFLSNEVLTEVVMQFFRRDPGGKAVVFETFTLTGARIVSHRRTVGHLKGLPFPELEEIGFRFDAMEVKSPKKAVRFDLKNAQA